MYHDDAILDETEEEVMEEDLDIEEEEDADDLDPDEEDETL